jgi:predicted Fe-Mo cluster-binding NifX family protein
MKVIISSTGKDLESDIDVRFGRCRYFLIVDTKTNKFKAIENTAQAQAGGAGITAAQIVANENPDAIISANLGPRSFQVFQQLNIKIYQAEGKIKKAIKDLKQGKLKEITNATGPQHQGL